MSLITLLPALISAAIVGIPGLLLYRANRRQVHAHTEHSYTGAAKDLADAAAELVGPYRTALDELRDELTDARSTLAVMHTEVERLTSDLTSARSVIKTLTEQLRHARSELRRVRLELARHI